MWKMEESPTLQETVDHSEGVEAQAQHYYVALDSG